MLPAYTLHRWSRFFPGKEKEMDFRLAFRPPNSCIPLRHIGHL